MAGKYGEIRQPLHIDNRFDYVLFSNEFKERYIGVWQVRPIPIPPEIEATDNKRLSRYPKAHPETMLAEYDASLYIDANIQIADQWVYDRIIELSQKGIDYAGVKLVATGRDCIYRHSYDMCIKRLEHDYNAIIQMHALRIEGFPEHYGLNENNIIYRRHNEKMKLVDELWWDWIVKYSYRDQFSYMYCLWKYSIENHYFLPIGEAAFSSSHFTYVSHEKIQETAKKRCVSVGRSEKWRYWCRSLSEWHYNHYCEQWVRLSKKSHSIFWLYFYGYVSFMLYAIPILFQIVVRKMKSFQ